MTVQIESSDRRVFWDWVCYQSGLRGEAWEVFEELVAQVECLLHPKDLTSGWMDCIL